MPDSILRNVQIHGRRTSMRLEAPFWEAVDEICRREHLTIHDLCTEVGSRAAAGLSLTSAIRLFVIEYFRSAATERGHVRAGHGRVSALFKEQEAAMTFALPMKQLHRFAS